MNVGWQVAGNLNVTDGGAVSNGDGHVGRYLFSNGEVTVSGSGSTWENDYLRVGHYGTGTLNIMDGGVVTSTYGYSGAEAAGIGEVNVGGSGSTWSSSENLFVGLRGTGTLNITDGGTVTNRYGHVGFGADAIGEVTVTGTGSQWNNSQNVFIGNSGTGTLNITDGGIVTNNFSHVGNEADSLGEVNVSGSGSTWNNSNHLYIGNRGTGTLNITHGGTVTNVIGYLGASSLSSVGEVKVSGAGSTWLNSGTLYVGVSGTGTLDVTDGGMVSNQTSFVGFFSGSTGEVDVSGAGAKWSNSAGMYVGGNLTAAGGMGTVKVSDRGLIETAGTNQVWSTGTIDIQNGGTFHLQSGTLTNQGLVQLAAGGTLINDGTFNGSLSGSGGLVTGSGTFSDLTVTNGTMVAPGNSPGTMSSLTTSWGAGGTYEWEMADLAGSAGTDWDLWHTNSLSITGGLFTIEMVSLGDGINEGALAGWDPLQDYSWLIATSTNGAFTTMSLQNLILDMSRFTNWNNLGGGLFGLMAANGGNELFLNFTASSGASAVPEPSSVMLLLCAGICSLVYYRRKHQRQTAQA